MEHNLKTIPKADFTIRASDAAKSQYIIKVIEWAENFKEELQQLNVSKEIVDYDSARKINPNYAAGFKVGVQWLKDRILGETQGETNR